MSGGEREAALRYRRLWRWHFYAALIAIPFILWQGLTGVAYLWQSQLADALWPQLRFVEPAATRVDLDTQLRAAMAGETTLPSAVRLSGSPARSTLFLFQGGDGLPSARFVDPYRGDLLGAVEGAAWLPGLSLKLHGGWPLGKAGSWLLELGACWSIVMVLTGLWMWWPRDGRGAAGTVYPRLRAGPRVFWRDLHAVAGVWGSAVFLAFLFTALPWTDAWGGHVLRPIQTALDQRSPPAVRAAHGGHAATAHAHATTPALARALSLAEAEGLRPPLELRIAAGTGPITVMERSGRTIDERVIGVARDGARVLERADWDDFKAIPRVVSTGVDLHEGDFFGLANRIVNTLVVAVLFWLVGTGLVGWYKRRPGRGLAPPSPVALPWQRALRIGAVAMCAALPLFGASVLAVLGVEALRRRLGAS